MGSFLTSFMVETIFLGVPGKNDGVFVVATDLNEWLILVLPGTC